MEPVQHADVVELPSVTVSSSSSSSSSSADEDDTNCEKNQQQQQTIRVFSLSLRSTTIELCSLGASITKFCVNNGSSNKDDDDDIVLGYKDIETLYSEGNPKYFGVIVGRVANRIKEGKFTLGGGIEYNNLAINNPPNHLHGGNIGFNQRIWDAEILPMKKNNNNSNQGAAMIRFSLISEDGDEGYPGKIMVSATYSLRDGISKDFIINPDDSKSTSSSTTTPKVRNNINNVVLRLELRATLLDGNYSPINLAQHSYFNLSKHDDTRGILDHQLYLNSSSYTPVDETSIPTREVRPLKDDPVMDFRRSSSNNKSNNDDKNNNNKKTKKMRTLEDAIRSFGTSKQHGGGMSIESVDLDLKRRQTLANPYGFDHNYVVDNQPGLALPKVGTLSCGRRALHVHSTAPGVQIYTSNYLNHNEDTIPICKGNYGPWSGICLETQHFPDSIIDNETTILDDDDKTMIGLFGKGRCCILTPENPNYEHIVEYNFVEEETNDGDDDDESKNNNMFVGSDTSKNKYKSIEEMWASQDLTTWYNRAKDYYEDNCSATVDGVLGGIGEISDIDLQGSREFLNSLVHCLPNDDDDNNKTTKKTTRIACEHGAGIGRVTKGVLLNYCDQCDLVESSSRLLYAAPDYIGNIKSSKCRYYNVELQDWVGKPNYYTIIWIQWVACYLRDDDLVKYLRRCATSLVEDGIIVIKENTSVEEMFVVDCDDASLTRSHQYWLDIIYKTGVLEVEKIEWQEGFPTDIYPVPMIALKRRKD